MEDHSGGLSNREPGSYIDVIHWFKPILKLLYNKPISKSLYLVVSRSGAEKHGNDE